MRKTPNQSSLFVGQKIIISKNITIKNNILFLDSSLDKDVKLKISNNIKNLLESKNNIFIKEIKKTEYGIHTY